jgi:hypothetical protein
MASRYFGRNSRLGALASHTFVVPSLPPANARDPVTAVDEMPTAVEAHKPGEEAVFTLVRGGKRVEVKVRLAETRERHGRDGARRGGRTVAEQRSARLSPPSITLRDYFCPLTLLMNSSGSRLRTTSGASATSFGLTADVAHSFQVNFSNSPFPSNAHTHPSLPG